MIRSSILGLGVALLAGCSFFETPSGTGTPPPPLAYAAPAAAVAPQAPATSLHRGSPGHGAVVSLQRALQQRGYYWGSVDGVYGTATKAAVMNFQRDLGTPVTGNAGHEEWSALGLSAGTDPVPSRPEAESIRSPGLPPEAPQ